MEGGPTGNAHALVAPAAQESVLRKDYATAMLVQVHVTVPIKACLAH